ncbi:MAG: branched-chain amino acid ABC transporter permease [Beijerinckiaceae bacterium]
MTVTASASLDAALPKPKADLVPLALPLMLALGILPFDYVCNWVTLKVAGFALFPFLSFSSWVTLTVAGLAMGLMIFVMASGLTLVFGLMHVLNFGHGAFISVGAYVATLILLPLAGFTYADSFWLNLVALVPAVLFAMVVSGVLGLGFERILIVPVYGQHQKQILVTMGGLIVTEEAIKALWGPAGIPLPLPSSLRGSFVIGDVAIEKYRLLAVIVGLVIFAAMLVVLNRTKIGLLIRAGVENSEMVGALGYRITRLFVGVFMVGSALAGLGGVMWALYREQLNASMGGDMMVLIFVVVIIGGLGSVGGCFLASLLVALLANYAGFLVPKLALVSNILLMVCVLLWRPRGLYQVTNR